MTEIEGIKFLIAPHQTTFFNGVQLDYTEGLFGMGEYRLTSV
ncbi:MAG TPA: hypothetical protein VK079_03320 [Bacillota bacterium]|nr:hypothetical protein [Bacillota bacterium]